MATPRPAQLEHLDVVAPIADREHVGRCDIRAVRRWSAARTPSIRPRAPGRATPCNRRSSWCRAARATRRAGGSLRPTTAGSRMMTLVTGSLTRLSTDSIHIWPVISPSGNCRLTRYPSPTTSTATSASGTSASTASHGGLRVERHGREDLDRRVGEDHRAVAGDGIAVAQAEGLDHPLRPRTPNARWRAPPGPRPRPPRAPPLAPAGRSVRRSRPGCRRCRAQPVRAAGSPGPTHRGERLPALQVRPQRLRHAHRPVRLLVGLEDRHDGPRDRHQRAVEGGERPSPGRRSARGSPAGGPGTRCSWRST